MWPQPTGVQTSELRFKDNTRGQGLLVKGPVSILKSMLFFVACAHENLILLCPRKPQHLVRSIGHRLFFSSPLFYWLYSGGAHHDGDVDLPLAAEEIR